ncbi:uncharacterized protein LOC142985076 isoform X12 [Anticarsia gemmatalis]|uniref:uncharacterized protein LOC142985076 isoform X12 n=1 Tax=Anticarsia gemmatalis TaxID=129554 RepID=UPI003F75E269
MDTKSSEWRPGPTVCRCCLTEGCYKDISTEYFWMGKREVYSEMLSDTFNVTIAYSQSGGPNSNSRLICEPCISRLRDACDFRRQVLECEKTFMQHLDPCSSRINDLEVPVVPLETDVKLERIKLETSDDDEFDDRDFDDDDDDMDDQPLTKLASKIPKKETVDILDLLDNNKAAEKRKSATKTKTAPAKKAKIVKKEPVKATASKVVPKTEKKKKDEIQEQTSVWQLTVPERKNAATFIQYTTVRPFIFMGFSFKCFYCTDYILDLPSLLEHTTTHTNLDRNEILQKYVTKSKRTLQVDISKLNCRLCREKFENLTTIKDHLIVCHGINFFSASNGMTEYKMELVNNMFKCHHCEEEFHLFGLLNSHMNSHVGKVVCENCGAGFLNQHLLLKHRETHVNKKFSCDICKLEFVKKTRLNYHISIVHKGKERVKAKKCPKCSETFKEHYSKMKHLKEAHGISNTFTCHVCNSKFPSRRNLTEHSNRFHTQKYKCKICSKCFTIESKLKQHLKAHTGERNYICPICKNAYMHKVSLKKHMRSHNSVFVCSQCTTSFATRAELVKHVNEWHPTYGEVSDEG